MSNTTESQDDEATAYSIDLSGVYQDEDGGQVLGGGTLTVSPAGVSFVIKTVDGVTEHELDWHLGWDDATYLRRFVVRYADIDAESGRYLFFARPAVSFSRRNQTTWIGLSDVGTAKKEVRRFAKYVERLQSQARTDRAGEDRRVRRAQQQSARLARRQMELDRIDDERERRDERLAALRATQKAEPAWRPGEVVVDKLVASTYVSGWINPFHKQVVGTLYATTQRLIFFTTDDPDSCWETEIDRVRSVTPTPGFGASLITADLLDGHRTWEPSCWSRPDRARFAANVRRIKLGLVTTEADVPSILSTRPAKISDVGIKTAAGLACPSCHGTNFRLKRRLGKAATTGAVAGTLLVGGPIIGAAVGSAIGAKNSDEVECITCARVYRRG